MGSKSYKSNEELADDYIKSTKSAATTLSEWGIRVNTFIQVGGEINGIEKTLNSLKIFQAAGIASVLLGLMDGALQIYCILNKIPSKEELIFESLNNIQSSVTSLSSQIDDIYEQLVNEIQLDTARAEIVNDVTYIDNLMKRVTEYTERLGKKGNVVHLEEEIFGKNNGECGNRQLRLEQASKKLLQAATTNSQSGDVQQNLMNAVYKATYGDASKIITQGQYLINYAIQALYIYNFLSARMCDKTTPDEIESYMDGARRDAKDLSDNLEGISSSAQKYLSKCRDEWFDNVTRCISENFLHKAKISVKDPNTYQTLCNDILQTLKRHWNWSDWLVIVNEASNGWDDHGQSRPAEFYQWRGKDGGFGETKENIDVRIARADIIDQRTYYQGTNPDIIATCQQVFPKYLVKRSKWDDIVKVNTTEDALNKIMDSVKDDVEFFRICWHDKNTRYACTSPLRVWYYAPKTVQWVEPVEGKYTEKIYVPYYEAIAFLRKTRVLPGEQENWRFCHKCSCLFYSGLEKSGACQAGSEHDGGHTWNYILAPSDGTPNLQNSWRWCKNCYELVYSGYENKGKCPAGGTHDTSGSKDYAIMLNDPSAQGQPGWGWCTKCYALWFTENNYQKPCPCGGNHNSGGGSYKINHWTYIYETDGTLVKAEGSDQVYVILDGKRCLIPDKATFKARGYSWNNIKTISKAILNGIPLGPQIIVPK